MKKILTLLFFVMSSLPLFAQEESASRAEPYLPPMEPYEYRAEPAQVMMPEFTARGMRVYRGGIGLSAARTRNAFINTPAYDEYMTGVRYNRIGNGLLWPGVGISGFGLMLMLYAAAYEGFYDYDYDYSFRDNGGMVGVGFFIFGLPFVITGTTFKIKAKQKVASAAASYNSYSGSGYSAEILFGPTSGGMGIVCRF